MVRAPAPLFLTHMYQFAGNDPAACGSVAAMQERFVFFEEPYDFVQRSNAGAAEVLEKLLALAWSADTTGWCEDGYIYNIARERNVLGQGMGEGDTRLLEIGWGGTPRIHYAKAEDVDLFVSPRQLKRLRAVLVATARAKVAA